MRLAAAPDDPKPEPSRGRTTPTHSLFGSTPPPPLLRETDLPKGPVHGAFMAKSSKNSERVCAVYRATVEPWRFPPAPPPRFFFPFFFFAVEDNKNS